MSILLLVSGLLAVTLLTIVVVREARRPPRHTAAYAIARGLPCDPGDIGLPFEAWTLDRPGGVRLPVWEIDLRPAGRAGDVGGEVPVPSRVGGGGGGDVPVPSRAGGRWGEGAAIGRPTVVFVHGWGQSRLDLLPQVPAWRAWCDRAVLYDLRGHGEAEGGLSALGHGEEEDLRELLRRLGPGPFILAGFSMGAVIAIQAAGEGGYLERSDRPLRDDPRCSGMGRIRSGRDSFERSDRPLRDDPRCSGIGRIRSGRPAMVSATASGAVSIAGVIAHGPYLDFGRAMRARLRAAGYPTRPITDLALLWLRLRGIRHRPVLAAAARVESPLLVICGMDDDVAPAVAAERLAAAAPRGVLHRVRGATHLDAREVDEAGHDAAIDAFVGSLDARTAATP